MTEADIIQLALGNLEKNAGIKGTWQNTEPKEVDGKVELKIDKVPL